MEVEGERVVQVKFVASVQHPNMEEPMRLGSIFYDQENKTLNLINHNTRLEDKVLLLGYTSKIAHADVIGQFGKQGVVSCVYVLHCICNVHHIHVHVQDFI